jgi:macrodomain Ter protein organizer (MatP/YcbG family)
MAWGYESSFTIEHIEGLKKKLSCKDCQNYIKEDKSCGKRQLYLPEDGYNSWRDCKFFVLDEDVTHYDEKKAQLLRTKNSSSIKKNLIKHNENARAEFKVGDKIRHKKFGNGEIIAKKGKSINVRFPFDPMRKPSKAFEKTLDINVCMKNKLIEKI